MGRRLRLAPVPVVLALALISLALSLGAWQTRRAGEKEALRERIEALGREPPVNLGGRPVEAAPLEFRRVQLRGRWRPDLTVYLDNRVRRGIPGYHVLTPLQIEDSDLHALVNRGWAPVGRSRAELPAVSTPEGMVEIVGEARIPLASPFRLGPDPRTGKVWQHVSVDAYRDWSKLALQPVLVLQTSEAADGLVREWDRPDVGIDRHRGYALQWYGLALLVAVFFVVLSLERTDGDEA